MAVPRIYRSIGQNPTANYDFSDITDGTGTQEYYFFTSSPSGTLTYHLGKQVLNPGYTTPATVTNHEIRTYLQANTEPTFSLSAFNLTQVAKGTAFVNFTLATTGTAGTSYAPLVTIYKNSTSIGAASGGLFTDANSVKTYNISVALTTTVFRKGDILKIKISAPNSGGVAFLQHDPLDRDVTGYTPAGGLGNHPAITAATNTTKCRAYIPYQLNL